MQGQERVIDRHIDHLLQKISEDASKGGSVDIIKWIHSAAFDIICDLTYSDTFHCLDSTEHHSWVLGIFYGVKKAVNKNFFFLSPIIEFLQTLVDTVKLVQAAKAQYYLAVDKAMVRIAEGKRSHTGRQDYISQMLKKNASGERTMSDEEISVNSLFLITAGSDTSATALPALLFYLRSNKEAYNTLTEEIRWAFDTERAINNRSTSSLEYLRACIDEALRMHPPLPSITPRISTGFFVRGLWVPEGVRASTFSSSFGICQRVNHTDTSHRSNYRLASTRRLGRRSEIRSISPIRTHFTPSASYHVHIRFMKSGSQTTISLYGSRSAMEPVIVSGRTWPTLRCVSLRLAFCTASTTRLTRAVKGGMII